jgi:hypothetical protein
LFLLEGLQAEQHHFAALGDLAAEQHVEEFETLRTIINDPNLQLRHLLQQIRLNDIQILPFHLLLNLKTNLIIPINKVRRRQRRVLPRLLHTLQRHNGRHQPYQRIEPIRARLENTPQERLVNIDFLLIDLHGVIVGLVLVVLAEEFGDFAVVLVEGEDG